MATKIVSGGPRRGARSAILLGGVLLLLGAWASTAWSATPPRFASGTYDVWQHGPSDQPMLVRTGRVIELHVHRQTIQVSTFSDGHLSVSRVLVPAGPVTYDRELRRWYQDFETAPNNPKATHERIRVMFRNDEFGTYDIAYRRRDNSWASEVLVKRPTSAD